MAEAENKMANAERKSVNLNSFFTPLNAFTNSLSELLSRPSLNIRVRRNNLSILKNLPSTLINWFR